MNLFKLFLVITVSIIIAGLILIGLNNLGRKVDAPTLGMGEHQSKTLYSQKTQNVASVSVTTDDDILLYDQTGGNPTIASFSVNDVLMFEGGDALPAGLREDVKYYVVTATNSIGFEISETKGGAVQNIADSTSQEINVFQSSNNGGTEVKGLTNITISLDAQEAPSVAFKFVGSIQTTEPDWYASQSVDNQYEYIAVYDAQSTASITGDTGIANSAGSDVHRLFGVFTEALNWVAVITENFASGSFTVKVTAEQ